MTRAKFAAFIGLVLLLGGCSATTLRCGTDGESSYVELVNVPQDISPSVRHYRDLCGFNYGADDATQ